MHAKSPFSKLVPADRNRLMVGRFNMDRIPKTRIPKGMKGARDVLARARQFDFGITYEHLKFFF